MTVTPRWLREQRRLRNHYFAMPQRWIVGPADMSVGELDTLKARFTEQTRSGIRSWLR